MFRKKESIKEHPRQADNYILFLKKNHQKNIMKIEYIKIILKKKKKTFGEFFFFFF